MAAKKKAELLEDAKAAGIDIPESKTVPEIKAVLAEAAPAEPDLDAADETIPGDPDNAPDAVRELAEFDAPQAPLPHTPTESLTEYAELGKPHDDEVRVDTSGENPPPPEVARGPLPGSSPDGFREDYTGPAQVAGPSQPVNTDPHQEGGTDTQPGEANKDREHVQESANAPGADDRSDRAVSGEDTGRPEDGDSVRVAEPGKAAKPAPGVPPIKDGV